MGVYCNKSSAASLLLTSLLLWTTMAFVSGSGNCDLPFRIRCPGSPGTCILHDAMCDGVPDCPNGEEESADWCEKYKHPLCTAGETICGYNHCQTWEDSCRHDYYICNYGNNINANNINETDFVNVCFALHHGRLPDWLGNSRDTEPADTERGLQISMEELATYVSAANCSLATGTRTGHASSCPMLYRPLAGACLAVLPFVLTWPEAKEACRGISGVLAEFEDPDSFSELIQHLIKNDFSSNFWTGGYFDLIKEAWSWSSGPDMPSSTPFWMMRYSEACTVRSSPTLGTHASCFHYTQAPAKHEVGFCAALQFEHMYYISDQGCYDKKKPLCIYDHYNQLNPPAPTT